MQWQRTEHEKCFTYEPEKTGICPGAGGRKLRQVCIYCPNYAENRKQDKEKGKKQ